MKFTALSVNFQKAVRKSLRESIETLSYQEAPFYEEAGFASQETYRLYFIKHYKVTGDFLAAEIKQVAYENSQFIKELPDHVANVLRRDLADLDNRAFN